MESESCQLGRVHIVNERDVLRRSNTAIQITPGCDRMGWVIELATMYICRTRNRKQISLPIRRIRKDSISIRTKRKKRRTCTWSYYHHPLAHLHPGRARKISQGLRNGSHYMLPRFLWRSVEVERPILQPRGGRQRGSRRHTRRAA